ncbi:MAG: prolyl oligopeptidase family serine peptidase [Bryobacteraceae bacterium]
MPIWFAPLWLRYSVMLLALTLPAFPQASAPKPLDNSAFAYDQALSLDVREHEVAIRNGIRIALVNFQVTPAVRAEGILVTPPIAAGQKAAAIIMMHSGGVFHQLPDAMLLAQAGAASLLISPIMPDWDASPETWPARMVQAVVSVRRGIDLLTRRSNIDSQRLAFAGHSYGALIGVDAAAADRRFRAAVVEGGLPGMSVHIRTAQVAFASNLRKTLGQQLDAGLRHIEPLDAIHYVGALAPTALLFQSAHLDPGVTDAQAQAFFNAASEPKTLKWYDTAHEFLDIAAISDRARFLALNLGLKPIEPILKAKIGIR